MAHKAIRKVVHAAEPAGCCPRYHEAIELIGRRWTGAIVAVMLQVERPMRFSEIAAAVPQLSDRLLSERVKELEARGVVERAVLPGPPVRVEYSLTAWAAASRRRSRSSPPGPVGGCPPPPSRPVESLALALGCRG